MKRYQKKLIIAAIAIPIFVGLTTYKRNKASDEVKSQTHELLQNMPSYEKEKQYIDKIFEASYKSSFESAYDYGGRRKSASFDEKKYITTVFDNMITMAKTDAKKDLSNELKLIKILINSSSSEE